MDLICRSDEINKIIFIQGFSGTFGKDKKDILNYKIHPGKVV